MLTDTELTAQQSNTTIDRQKLLEWLSEEIKDTSWLPLTRFGFTQVKREIERGTFG